MQWLEGGKVSGWMRNFGNFSISGKRRAEGDRVWREGDGKRARPMVS
jgi:hypothetical protein